MTMITNDYINNEQNQWLHHNSNYNDTCHTMIHKQLMTTWVCSSSFALKMLSINSGVQYMTAKVSSAILQNNIIISLL